MCVYVSGVCVLSGLCFSPGSVCNLQQSSSLRLPRLLGRALARCGFVLWSVHCRRPRQAARCPPPLPFPACLRLIELMT